MVALVGYTGFVGSNIYSEGKIDAVYNSKNIQSAYGTEPDLLIYSGLRAEKYLANNDPEKDMELIDQAIENISKIKPKKLVLISTVDVLKNPIGVDENGDVETDGLQAYGYNRYQLEIWARENYKDALIIRLPGLFGKNIKKNFIYDYINVIPFMLNEEKYLELVNIENELEKYYHKQDNGFYKVDVKEDEKEYLKNIFRRIGFSALNFTDSRSRFQLYNLSRLWNDINTALDNNLTMWHPATEPVTAAEIYKYLTGEEFVNELNGVPANYDYKTAHANVFGGTNGYICDKETVLEEIKEFVNM
jgi:hypothetical protein